MATFTGTAGADVADAGTGTLTGFTGGTLPQLQDSSGDLFNALDGADSVVGGAGNDTINGNGDNDTLSGGAGIDLVYGGLGDDVLTIGGRGSSSGEQATGGDGNDTIVVTGGGNARVDGDSSNSWSSTPSPGAGGNDTIDLSAVTSNGFFSISAFAGGGNDTVIGSGGIDLVYGNAGEDQIQAGGGNDEIYGGTFLDPESDNDTLSGGAGQDTIGSAGGIDVIDGGVSGADLDLVRFYRTSALANLSFTAIAEGGGPATVTGDGSTITNVERFDFRAGSGDDTIVVLDNNDTVLGGAGADTITLNGGNDSADGGAGTDSILGGLGNETINGDGDNDTLNGGTGVDQVYGGLGDDQITIGGSGSGSVANAFGGDGSDTILVTGGGTAQISGDGQNSWNGTPSPGAGGNDTIDLSAVTSNGAFTITVLGGGGNDTITGSGGIDNIAGDAGEDAIDAGGGNDTLFGGTSSDVDTSNDTLSGGAGQDTIGSAGGIDVIDGGVSGADLDLVRFYRTSALANLSFTAIAEGGGPATVTGDGSTIANVERFDFRAGSGDDTIVVLDNADTVVGGAGADTITLNGGNDSADGGAGTDSILGGLGNDTINGDGDNDTLNGGTGVDQVYGGLGDDQITIGGSGSGSVANAFGGDGSDTILVTGGGTAQISGDGQNSWNGTPSPGAGGNDTIDLSAVTSNGAFTITVLGGGGNDTITGSGGIDNIAGDAGEDAIDAGGGNDTLFGGTSSDVDTSNDTLSGGAGQDTIGSAGGIDVIDGGVSGADLDLVRFYRTSALANLSFTAIAEGGGPATVTGDGSTITNVERFDFRGGAGDDTIVVLDNADTVMGGAGADTITLNGGNDSADGGAGTDSILGGLGNDTINGDGDNDTLNGGTGVDLVFGGLGDDHITLGGSGSSSTAFAFGGDGNDTIAVTGGGVAQIQGDSSNSSSSTPSPGAGGNDTIDLSAVTSNGAFTINVSGGGGNDTVVGSGGNDNINGDGGIDTVSYAAASGGVFVNLSLTTQQNTVSAGLDTLNTIENLVGSSHADTLTGNTGNNTLAGGDGADTLSGGSGNDFLDGGAGSDTATFASATNAAGLTITLVGGAATVADAHASGEIDTLVSIEDIVGSVFDDTITGDSSANRLEGGLGGDTIGGGDGNDAIFGDGGPLPANVVFNGTTGKYYQYVASTVTALVAQSNAAAALLGGVPGQLVTIQSAAENAYVSNTIVSSGARFWIGASDAATEGEWRWLSSGAQFWQGDHTGGPVGGYFSAWSNLEPNNVTQVAFPTGEDYVVGNWANAGTGNPQWNDQPDAAGFVFGYVIEWEAATLGLTDRLTGGLGSDTLTGGGGADVFVRDAGDLVTQADVITDFTPGTDKIDLAPSNGPASWEVLSRYMLRTDGASGTGPGNVVLQAMWNGQLQTITLQGVAGEIVGGVMVSDLTAADFVFGGGPRNVTGTANADSIFGSLVGDTLSGSSGNDTIIGDDGADSLDGGTGDDTFVAVAADIVAGEQIDGGDDIDTLRIDGGGSASLAGVTLTNVERITLTHAAGTTLTVVSEAQANLVFSAAGSADTVVIQGFDFWGQGLAPLGTTLDHLFDAGVETVAWIEGGGDNTATRDAFGVVTVIGTDTSGQLWETSELVFNAAGERETFHVDFDDGHTFHATFANDLPVQILIDYNPGGNPVANPGGVKLITQDFDAAGRLDTHETEYFNGQTWRYHYDDGGAVTHYDVDQLNPGGTYGWTINNQTFTPAGVLTSQHVVVNNGNVIDRNYAGGVITQEVVADGGAADPWTTIMTDYVGGAFKQQTFVYDDGSAIAQGNAAANSITGRSGPGAGVDVLIGYGGADTFVFTAGFGTDVIVDFTDGVDKLDLTAFGVTDLASLDAVGDVFTWNGGVAIDIGSNRIQLDGFTLANFGDQDLVS